MLHIAVIFLTSIGGEGLIISSTWGHVLKSRIRGIGPIEYTARSVVFINSGQNVLGKFKASKMQLS